MAYIATPSTPATATPAKVEAANPVDSQENKTLNNDAMDNTSIQRKAVALRIYLQRSVDQNVASGVTTGVAVTDLQSGRSLYQHDTATEQFAASVNKLPIARLVLADLRSGKLTNDQVLTWTASDVRAGAGVYDQPGAPTSATVKDLLFDMLNPSGNTAVRVFVNQAMGGAATVNNRFKTELNLQHTYLQPLEGTAFYVGNTNAQEAATNITALLSGEDQYQQFVKHALATNIYTDYGVRTQLAGNDYITLANKVGILDDPDGNNRHDVGLVYNTKTHKTYGYAFLNTAHGSSFNLATSQAGVSLADMGRGVLRYSGDKRVGNEKALRDAAPFVDKRVRY